MMRYPPGMKYLLQTDQSQTLYQRMIERLVYVFWKSHYDILEVGVAIPVLLIALQLANPYYSTFDSNPATFYGLNYIGALIYPKNPEVPWAVMGLLGACLEIWACLYEHRIMRVIAPLLMFFYLSMFALCIGLINPYGTGVSVYAGLSVLCLILVLRSMTGLA